MQIFNCYFINNIFLIRVKNKTFENKLILISFIFIFFSSISSILSDNIFFTLKSSLYLRFILFLMTVSILFLFQEKFLIGIFNILMCCYIILLFDATIQFFLNKIYLVILQIQLQE